MVRAIERNESIMQSTIAERIQQIQQQHPDMQQRYFQTQLSQERRKMQNKANAPDEAFKAAIQEEEGRKKQQDERNRKEAAPAPQEDDPGGQEQQSHIDIEV